MKRLGRWATTGILLALLAWGALLRLWNLGGRPFWRDEAWVATSLRDLPYGEFWHQTDVPLPPLFAAAAKFAGQIGGPREVAWRLLPALCGILVLPLLYSMARLLRCPRTLALAITALGATSISLVTWSRELKHYSYEALASVLIAWLVFRLRRPSSPRLWGTLLAAVLALAAVSPWYAYGSTIPIAAMLVLLLVARPAAAPRSRAILAGILGLVVLAVSTYGLWSCVARGQASDPALANYTRMWCLDATNPNSWARVGAYFAAATCWLIFPASWFIPVLDEADVVVLALVALAVWLVALFGLRTWPRQTRRELAWWTLAPLLLLFGLALLRYYPLGVMRMMQFWVPPMLFALAAGAVRIWRVIATIAIRRRGPALASGVCLALLPSVYVIREPLEHRYYVYHDFPAVLKALDQQRGPGEWVVVTLGAVPCIRYYAPNLAPPVQYTPVAGGTILKPGTDPDRLIRSTAERSGGRFWILLTAAEGDDADRRKLLRFLDAEGYVVRTVQRGGLEGPPTGVAELLLATRK